MIRQLASHARQPSVETSVKSTVSKRHHGKHPYYYDSKRQALTSTTPYDSKRQALSITSILYEPGNDSNDSTSRYVSPNNHVNHYQQSCWYLRPLRSGVRLLHNGRHSVCNSLHSIPCRLYSGMLRPHNGIQSFHGVLRWQSCTSPHCHMFRLLNLDSLASDRACTNPH